jgi:hypothetical protein
VYFFVLLSFSRSKIRRLKRVFVLVVIAFVLGVSFMIYNIMGSLSSFFWNVPYLAGLFGSKSYLVLLQNNYELRPGGGFITAYAEVKASFGSISYEVHDVYDLPDPLSRVTAPYPFEFLIGQNDPFYAGFTFRDANFSPDFQESAEEVLAFYYKAKPDADIDAVITVDFHVFEGLLDLYDGIEVNGIEYTSDNFFYLTQVVSKDIDTHNVDALTSRKNVLTPLAQETFRQVKSRASGYAGLMRFLKIEMDQKHVQVYFTNAKGLQAKFRRYGWTGELDSSDTSADNVTPSLTTRRIGAGERVDRFSEVSSDFLHANLANIGGRKGDRYLQKEYYYVLSMPDLSITDDVADQFDRQAKAKFTARFTHQGDYNIQSDIYQGYFRLYVPDGSILLSPSPTGLEQTEQGRGLGFTYFADMFRLKPTGQVEIVYEYLLPKAVTAENYHLYIPKQAGTDRDEWNVAVRFKNDSRVQSLEKIADRGLVEFNIRENLATWSGVQESDLSFATELLPDTTPPIVLWQEFVDGGQDLINIRFHEAIDESELGVSSVAILDLDTAHPSHDEIEIERVWFDDNGRDMWIRVDGVIKAPLERYKMTLYGIRDLSGNVIDPNPKEFTLVQR